MSQQLTIEVSKYSGTERPEAMFDVRLRETAPDELTVQLAGELDVASAELVSAVLRCRKCPKVIRLDLAGLSFMDCAGLRAIEAVRDRLLANAGRLVLVHVSARIDWLLRMADLDRTFPTEARVPASGENSRCASLPY